MNLNWFKFEPAKWAMGRISKQKDAVAGAFVRLMCKYWSEGCDMTPEDAELETGSAAYKSLVDAKILKIVAGKAHINFLDEQWKKELEKHENRKEWGAKGGHRKAEKAKPEDTPSHPLGSLEDTHSIPLAESSRREEKRREEKEDIQEADASPSAREVFEMYNRLCPDLKPANYDLSGDTRKAKAKVVGKKLGREGITTLFTKANASSFLRGETSRNGWMADLDFLLTQRQVTKVLEGGHDNRQPKTQPVKYNSGYAEP